MAVRDKAAVPSRRGAMTAGSPSGRIAASSKLRKMTFIARLGEQVRFGFMARNAAKLVIIIQK